MDSPLVPPGPELTATERTRFARHLLLPGVGALGQRRLRGASVLLVGAGGLGSPAALYLAAAGVGRLAFVDDDEVDLTNLQRQILHGDADIGRPKVDSARDRIATLAPGTEVVTHRTRRTGDNALSILAEHDVVVDGADNFPTRELVGRATVALGLPHVWASVLRFEAQVSVWWPPQGPCYHCIFPVRPAPGAVASCATGGVLGSTVGAVGSILATETIKLLTGVGDPLVGRLLVHDGLAQTWDTLPVRRHPDCAVCGSTSSSMSWPPGDAASSDGGVRGAVEPRPSISVTELAGLLGREDTVLIDVREAGEREIVTVPGARHVPLDRVRRGEDELAAGQVVYVHCKSGARSAEAVDLLRARGVDARDVRGGVLAWVSEVDPEAASY